MGVTAGRVPVFKTGSLHRTRRFGYILPESISKSDSVVTFLTEKRGKTGNPSRCEANHCKLSRRRSRGLADKDTGAQRDAPETGLAQGPRPPSRTAAFLGLHAGRKASENHTVSQWRDDCNIMSAFIPKLGVTFQ